MKKYLFIGGLVLFFGSQVFANNPFDIAKKIQKIETKDTILINSLEEYNINQDNIKSNKNIHKEKTHHIKVSMPQKKATAVKKDLDTHVKQKSKNKIEDITVKIDKESDKVNTKVKKEVVKKVVPKVQHTTTKTQSFMNKIQSLVSKTKTVTKPQISKSTQPKVLSVEDINITRDKLEAAMRAKRRLQEAIREVNQED
jgi:hypothetical protein